MEDQKKQIRIVPGLKPTHSDRRDFDYGKIFGTLEELPTQDFVIGSPIDIKQQFETDCCVACGGASMAEYHENTPLSMEYLFAKIKEEEGDYTTWGSDPRTMAKIVVSIGLLEEKNAPLKLKADNRNEIANIANWPNEFLLEEKAFEHRQKSYFFINQGNYQDLFDAFRAALWQNKDYKRAIGTGIFWCPEWTSKAVIDKMGTPTTPHFFIFIGQKTINGKIYLVAQLSNGTAIGDNGLFYFSREVLNASYLFMLQRMFLVKHMMFIDIPPQQAQQICWSFWLKVWHIIRKYFLDEIFK